MNRMRMGIALVLTGFMVIACGRGFEPMKSKKSSTDNVVVPELGNGQAPGNGTIPALPSVASPLDNSRTTTEQLTQELWPEALSDDPNQKFVDNKQLASIIKGIRVVFVKTNDPLTSDDTRDLTTQIATGCNDVGKVTGEEAVSRVNFAYLKNSPTLIIGAGSGANYKLKFACTDSLCQNATLYITSDIPVTANSLSTKTVSAAVYMQRLPNTGKLVPMPNTVIAQDGRYITLEAYDTYKTSCALSAKAPLPNGNISI